MQISISEKWSIPIVKLCLGEIPSSGPTIGLVAMIHITGGFLVHRMAIQEIKNENGQAAIEFILSFVFGVGIVFLFVNQALNFTAGYLGHYVNFMASRAFLTAEFGLDNRGGNMVQAINLAENEVFNKYPLAAFGVNAKIEAIDSEDSNGVFTGTVLEFERPLSSITAVGGAESVLLYSESFLGREPFRITCYEQICAAITGSPGECRGGNLDAALYDNGC